MEDKDKSYSQILNEQMDRFLQGESKTITIDTPVMEGMDNQFKPLEDDDTYSEHMSVHLDKFLKGEADTLYLDNKYADNPECPRHYKFPDGTEIFGIFYEEDLEGSAF